MFDAPKYHLSDHKVSELFSGAKMANSSLANGKYRDEGINCMGTVGHLFASGLRLNDGMDAIPFGNIRASRYIRLNNYGKFFCYGIGGQHLSVSTYLKPSDLLADMFIKKSESRDMQLSMSYSLEFIKTVTGTVNVVALSTDFISRYFLTETTVEEVREMVHGLLDKDKYFQEYKTSKEQERLCATFVSEDGTVDVEGARAAGFEVREYKSPSLRPRQWRAYK